MLNLYKKYEGRHTTPQKFNIMSGFSWILKKKIPSSYLSQALFPIALSEILADHKSKAWAAASRKIQGRAKSDVLSATFPPVPHFPCSHFLPIFVRARIFFANRREKLKAQIAGATILSKSKSWPEFETPSVFFLLLPAVPFFFFLLLVLHLPASKTCRHSRAPLPSPNRISRTCPSFARNPSRFLGLSLIF